MTLSVVMPTFKDSKYISQAIDAILTQSYEDFELIIINDASPDNTEEIVKSYMANDKRIKYWVNEKNLGVAKSLNIGCKMAKGVYIFTASSDDYINPGFFKNAMQQLLDNPKIGMCFGDVIFKSIDKSELKRTLPKYTTNAIFSSRQMWKNQRKYNLSIPVCSAIVKKDALQKQGFFLEEVGYFCDLMAYTPIALSEGAIYIPFAGANFYLSRDEETSNRDASYREILKMGSDILTYLKKDKKLFRILCYSTLLPKSFHYSTYVLFLLPKHWSHAFPMVMMKLFLLFTKPLRFLRERIKTSNV